MGFAEKHLERRPFHISKSAYQMRRYFLATKFEASKHSHIQTDQEVDRRTQNGRLPNCGTLSPNISGTNYIPTSSPVWLAHGTYFADLAEMSFVPQHNEPQCKSVRRSIVWITCP
ncbi:hypothetical protein DPMN_123796 [Dreissena polymorpha]|uniref:Uncharacterized protein n=1 Tax=Dreissena polymorpha TaxID=45954 RepID=A0A9D4GSA6_DREPO|nr:hypothetical protein DPMN_123796 [Dreissena polymorpha]